MRIKHWQGYGCVTARKCKDSNPSTLMCRVEGDHEWGIILKDEYDLYYWLVRRFDKDVVDYATWSKLHPIIEVKPGFRIDIDKGWVDLCDYYFTY